MCPSVRPCIRLILDGGSPSTLARLERPAIYFNGFLFWCSALMLFCCMTVCRPLTARTDDRTHLCIAWTILRLPRKRSTEGRKIITTTIVIPMSMFMVLSPWHGHCDCSPGPLINAEHSLTFAAKLSFEPQIRPRATVLSTYIHHCYL